MKAFFWTVLMVACAAARAQDFEIFVSDAGNFNQPPWQIIRYDADGGNGRVFTTEQLAWPQDVRILESQGVALVSNLNSNRINRHDLETGEFIDVFANDVSGPTRMRVGPDGLLYVLQWTGSGTVRRYQLDGTPLGDFTQTRVTQAIGIDWDTDGNLYVASFNGATVRRFDTDGNDLGVFINSDLQGPTNLHFMDDGTLLVLDWSGGAIRQFNDVGQFLGNFATGLVQPEGIAVLPNGNLLVGNGGPGTVRQYEPDGTLVEDTVAADSGLLQPNGITVRPLTDPFPISATLNDAWFNASTPGQGFLISVFPTAEQVFVAWFTFDAEVAKGQPTIGGAGQRWFTAQGPFSGNIADLTIFATTGGLFNASEPAPATQSVGSMTIRFSGCNEATVVFSFDGMDLSGDIPIQRVSGDNLSACEAVQALR